MTSESRTQYVLITGCTPGGIGHYLALEFAEKDFQVLATVRDPSKYTSPHAHIQYLPLEVTSEESIRALHSEVASITSGKLDVLYNNAGKNYTVPALDINIPEVEDLFQTNVFAVMAMCKTFAPLVIEAKGTIVQTGSLAGVMPYVFASAYSASKAALHAYSDTLRVELAPLGVRVLNLVTGGVKSNIARTHRELAPDSYYQPIAKEYEQRLTLSQQMGMDTQQYARSCVREVLGGDGLLGLLRRKRWVWEGSMSWLVWFVWSYLPSGGMDWYFSRKYNLSKLYGTAGPDKKRV